MYVIGYFHFNTEYHINGVITCDFSNDNYNHN